MSLPPRAGRSKPARHGRAAKPRSRDGDRARRAAGDHSTFVIGRELAAPAAHVFAAWSNADKKRRWFACHDDWATVEYKLDFRIGGTEVKRVVTPDGVAHDFHAHYLDVVSGHRIIYAYDMHVGETRISVSLVTVSFEAAGTRTKMTFTEQVVFLDGHGDLDERREGTEVALARLDRELAA